MQFYELKDDIEFPKRWYLGDVLNINNWDLLKSAPEYEFHLKVSLVKDGEEMDFTYTEVYGLPVVSERIKRAISEFSGLHFIPLHIVNRVCDGNYYLMVVSNVVDCVDENKSIFRKFELNDPVRPDKAGQYRAFIKLYISPDKVESLDIFRLGNFEIALIVSEAFRSKLESLNVSGAKFARVTDVPVSRSYTGGS